VTRIGILETGIPQKDVVDIHSDFPQMFRNYFKQFSDLAFTTVRIFKGEEIPLPKSQDAWIITGSPSSVYDDLVWLPLMEDFVRESVGQSVPTLGICFGHQLMAQAFGGTVVKSDKGVGIGVHDYEITEAGKKMLPGLSPIRLIAAHGDQVTIAPDSAALLATSSFCTNAAFSYGDSGLSIQAHPEFTAPGAIAITHRWAQKSSLPAQTVAVAMDSFVNVRPNSHRLASELHKFLIRTASP